jgi:type VI secretion system protein ImpJ
VTDDTTGEEPVHIPRLRPRFSLWAGERPPARFESLPLLRVHVNNDAFQEYEYIPPVMTVAPDSPLGIMCAETTNLVRAKSYVLADHLRGGPFRKAESDLIDLRMKVYALAMGLPGPEAALQSGRIHPFALYLMFCQLAGYVGPITAALVCPQFAPYRHDDLLGTFRPVLEYIRGALAEAVVESWLALPFRTVNGRFEAGPSEALDRAVSAGSGIDAPQLALALRVPAESTESEVHSWGEDCVIGSSGKIDSLLATRVPGAKRRRTERLPGLVAPRGMLLMALALDEETARPGEALQIVERFTNRGRPADAILYIQRAAAERTGT